MIEKYLKELLVLQDTVVVQHLGTFTATTHSSQQTDESTLTPPNKVISFSYQITDDNNTDLQNTVVETEGIDVIDFKMALLEYVEKVQYQLSKQGSYTIAELGTLVKKTDGQIVFEQDKNQIFLADSFGLPPVSSSPIITPEYASTPTSEIAENKTEDEQTPVVNLFETQTNPLAQNQTNQTTQESQTATATQPERQTDDAPTPEPKTDFPWWLVVIPLVFLFIFFVYLFAQPDAMRSFKALFTGEPEQVAVDMTPKPQESTSSQTPENQSDNATNNTPVAPTDTPPPTDVTPTPITAEGLITGKFYLVYGSFSSEKAAGKAINELSAAGQTGKIIPLPSKNLYRVVVGEFDTDTEAKNQKQSMGAKFSKMWVLKAQ